MKARVTHILYLIFLLLFLVFSCIFAPLLIFVELLFMILFTRLLKKYLTKKYSILNKYLINKEYDKIIELCLVNFNKTYSLIEYNTCYSYLVNAYLFKDEIDKVKELLKINTRYARGFNFYYIRMIIALDNKDYKEFTKYYNKLVLIKRPIYKDQIYLAKLIKTMIDTKVYNEEIIEKSSFALVHRIVSIYKEGNEIEFINKEEVTIKLVNVKILDILLIISIVSLFVAMGIIALLMGKNNYHVDESSYYFVKYLRILLLFSIFPLLLFIYGIKYYNQTGNGKIYRVISLFLLVIFLVSGTSSFIYTKDYESADEYLNYIEEIIDVEVDETSIIIVNEKDVITSTAYNFNYKSIIRFEDNEKEVYNSINSNINFLDYVNEDIKEFIGPYFFISNLEASKYLLYCIDIRSYNVVYDVSGYRYLMVAYSDTSNYLSVYDIYHK